LRRLSPRRPPKLLILVSHLEPVTGRFLDHKQPPSLELPPHLLLPVLDGRLVLEMTGLLNRHPPPPTTGELLMPSQLTNGKFRSSVSKKIGNSAFGLWPRVNLVSTHEGKILLNCPLIQ
jgi:hypothetical protein